MDKPLISIVLPVYNGAEYILKTIDSVLKQTYFNWELIVIDDGSVDDSRALIATVVQKDSRVKLFWQENSGPARARNYGLKEATGVLVTFIDADDWMSEEYLNTLIAPFLKQKDMSLVCAGYYELNEYYPKGIALHDFKFEGESSIINKDAFLENIFTGLTGVLWGKMFDLSIIKVNAIVMPESLKLSEDMIFVIRYVKRAKNIALVQKPIYYYNRLNTEGLSGRFDESYLEGFKIFNALVAKELSMDNVMKIKLKQKTSHHLIKLLKDQSGSAKQLKQAYLSIVKSFNKDIFCPVTYSDKLFVTLLKKRKYSGAFFLVNQIKFLRKLKHA